MPREREELIRPSKFREQGKVFILAYEGNNTEPQYYEALKEKLRYKEFTLHIESLKRGKTDTNSAPKHVFNKLKAKKSEYNFKDSDEFWMIIDKDNWVLDEWVTKCQNEKNFHIALSNPCFEIWLLLHRKDINEYTSDEVEKIFKNEKITKRKRHLEDVLSDILGYKYGKSTLKTEDFIPLINKAIEQATVLDTKDVYTNLGSHNYILVQKLLE